MCALYVLCIFVHSLYSTCVLCVYVSCAVRVYFVYVVYVICALCMYYTLSGWVKVTQSFVLY